VNEIGILAASFMDKSGYGNDRTGLRPWPASIVEPLRRGTIEELRWSHLFSSETSRFGRMDHLSRLGLMAVELLDADLPRLASAERDSMGVCVETHSGCTVTDMRFLEMPLASTFAYTLPSTVVGEICIQHRFRGPVMCLLPAQDHSGSVEVALGWLRRGEASAGICVACEAPEKKIAAPGLAPHDPTTGGWLGCALLIGSRAGATRAYPLRMNSLSCLARSLCALDKNAPAQGA
jgi:hypothetical protein